MLSTPSQASSPALPGTVLLRMGLLASGYALMLLVSVGLMPSIPAMGEHFGSVALAQVILIGPAFLKIVGGPAAAWLMRRYGRRKPLLVNLALIAVCAALSIVFDSFAAQLVLRLLMGFGAAAVATISTTLVGDYFEGATRDRALSWTGIAPMLGSVFGLFVGGLIAQQWGWQWTNAMLLLAVPLWLGALLYLPEPELPVRLNDGNAVDASLPAGFRYFLGIAALTTVISVVGGYQLPLLMAANGIDSASFSGGVLAMSSILAAVAAALYPRLRRRAGPTGVFVWIMAGNGIVYALLSLGGDKLWFGGIAPLAGLAGGLLYPFCTGWAIERSSAEARPRAVGLVMSAIFIGSILCPFLGEIIRTAYGAHATFATAAAVALSAGIAAALFRSQTLSPVPPRPLQS